MTPHVARCAEAVQHDHCRAMTADPHMDGCTVGFDRPRLHHGREGINPIYVGMLAHFVYSRRSEEHTSELQYSSISYAVFCLKKKIIRSLPTAVRTTTGRFIVAIFVMLSLTIQLPAPPVVLVRAAFPTTRVASTLHSVRPDATI